MKIRFCQDVTFVADETTAYIKKGKSDERFNVGGAGLDYLRLIDGNRTLDDIIEGVLAIYGGVEPYILVKDMESFTADLVANNLIEVYRD